MDKQPQKVTDDVAEALERCAENLSISEFSRVTGVRIELLRRFINRQVSNIRAETWDKIYPQVKPFLVDPKEPKKNPRIGPGYRRHAELVAMVSDQKVLLDTFAVIPNRKHQEIIAIFTENNPEAAPSAFKSLSADENKLMGAYLALSDEEKNIRLRRLVNIATDEVRKTRREIIG